MKYLTLNKETLSKMDGLDKMSYIKTVEGQPVFKNYPEWSGYALGGNKLYCDDTLPNDFLKINHE